MQFSTWHSLYSTASILILLHQGMFHVWENRKLVWGASAETLHWKTKRHVLNLPIILTRQNLWLALAGSTSKETQLWVQNLAHKMGQHPVTAGRATGWLGNRLGTELQRHWIYEEVWCNLLEKWRSRALFPFQMLPLNYEAMQQTGKYSMLTLARC